MQLGEDMTTPSLSTLFRESLKVGCLGFGGPAGQIALMHRVFVDDRKWIDDARFQHMLAFCMLLPGPEAQQLATYIGWRLRGWAGACRGAKLTCRVPMTQASSVRARFVRS